MYENLGYQAGKMLEDEMVGKPKKESQEKYNDYISLLEQKIQFMDVVKVIETAQRNECTNPTRYFPKHLRQEIAKNLGLDLEDNPYSVEFYNAVGTILDYKFGTDAFFAIKEPGTNFNARISMDLTTNSSKDQYKADIIAYFPDGSLDETNKEERAKLDEIIQKTAKDISDLITIKKDTFFHRNSGSRAA